MRLEQLVDRVRRGQLAHGGDGERLDDEVRLEQVRDGVLNVEVGASDPQLGHDPVLGVVARRPDRIVRTGLLVELDRYRNEVAAGIADDEENERSRHVASVGVAADRWNVVENGVVGYVQLAVLQSVQYRGSDTEGRARGKC